MLTPLLGPIGSGVPSIVASAGAVATAMGAMAIGLLLVTAIVIVVARPRASA